MLQLQKNGIYTLKVIKVVNSRRKFFKGEVPHYTNDITFSNGTDTVKCEYPSTDSSQDTFIEGCVAMFKVTFYKNENSTEPTYEIEPVGVPSEWGKEESGVAMPVSLKSGNGTVSGHKATFALAYAKDVMIAIVPLTGLQENTEEFSERMFSLADKMYNYLDQKTK